MKSFSITARITCVQIPFRKTSISSIARFCEIPVNVQAKLQGTTYGEVKIAQSQTSCLTF